MTKRYRPYSPKQAFLLPPSPTEWLPEDHLALFVMDVVGQLDLSAVHQRYRQADPRGTHPYHPLMSNRPTGDVFWAQIGGVNLAVAETVDQPGGDQFCGSNSSSRAAGCEPTRPRTSVR